MDEDRSSWPLVVGITAGIVGGVIAGVYLYSMRAHDEPDNKLRDAREIIEQCNQTIKDLEARIARVRQS